MPQKGITSIRTESGKLNFSKGGSTSIYVDQSSANASDDHDGYSWERPKLTIQGAIDVLESWMEIWIRGGTYRENIVIDHENVVLHGVVQAGADRVEIAPASGVPLTISVGYAEIERIAIVATNANAISLTGPGHNIHDCYIELDSDGTAQRSAMVLDDCDKCHIYDNHFSGENVLNTIGIRVDGSLSASVDGIIRDNFFEKFGTTGVAGQGINLNNAQRWLITRNIFDSNYNGIYCEVKENSLHTICGNQFYSNFGYDICDNNPDQQVSGIYIMNNFFGYQEWFTDYDHDGIADTVVCCYLNYDYSPLAYPHYQGIHLTPGVVT